MRALTKWVLLLSTTLLSLWAIGQQPAMHFRMPVISDDGSDVLYQAIPINTNAPTLEVFQMPPASMSTLGMWVYLNGVPLTVGQDAARPHFSTSQGQHIVYMRGVNGAPLQVFLYDRVKGQEILISGYGTDPTNRTPGTRHSVCPRTNKNGRIIVFASLDTGLHDPNGDGTPDPLPPYATPTNSAPWVIYVHDRNVDGNRTYDETPPSGLTATYAVAAASSPYVALSPDTGGTYIAYQVRDQTTNPPSWALLVKKWRNNIVTDPPVAVSPVAFSIPSIVGIVQPVNGAIVAFTANRDFGGNKAGVWLAQIDFSGATPTVTLQPISLNNGVNGALVISPDVTHVAFHTTASDIVITANLLDRNGVDDIYVFDLTTMTPIWSTLLVRGLPSPQPPIGPFDPCVHPSLSSLVGNSLFVAFEHWVKDPVTGAQQVIVRRSQILPSSNLLYSWRLKQARRFTPLP